MPVVVVINRVLLVLLGVMTGVTKLVFMDAEMTIFRNAGFPDVGTVAFGVVQMAAALCCLHRTTRTGGALLLALTFVAATGVLFINGLYPFGIFSLLFPASALFEAYAGRASGS